MANYIEYIKVGSGESWPVRDKDALHKDGGAMTENIAMAGHLIRGLGDPTDIFDAVNKKYVDNATTKIGNTSVDYAKKVGNPYNLLDNSDFRNPVNQRGQTSHATVGYTIDRWKKGNGHGTVTVNNKHITLQGGSSDSCWFQQKIPNGDSLVGKTLTLAAMDSNGELIIGSKTVSNSDNFEVVRKDWGLLYWNAVTNDALLVSIVVNVGYTKSFVWAALYEGEYTAETLPEYQPKGYGAELAECKRYYQKLSFPDGWGIGHCAIGGGGVHIPLAAIFPMRIENPTVSGEIDALTAQGWQGAQTPTMSSTIIGFVAKVPYVAGYTFESGKSYLVKGTIELSADL